MDTTSLLEFLPYLFRLATPFVVARGIYFLFDRAETVARNDVRKSVSQWLRGLDTEQTMKSWPRTFVATFDSVFGERHLSWRCLWRSCVASLMGVMILTLVWAAFRFDQAVNAFEGTDITGGVVAMVILAVLFNLLPDYLSLVETRVVLRWMSLKPSISRICALLVLDAVLTGVIFCIGAALVFWVFFILENGSFSEAVGLLWEILLPGFQLSTGSTGDICFGIFFYSTYFTSVWVWFYALSGGAIRTLGFGVDLMRKFLDIDNVPIRALGYVSSVIVILLFVVVFIFVGIR